MIIRVILADDHPAMRAGLRGTLEKAEGIDIVGEASDGLQALKLIEELRPDIALLDCRLPEMTGWQVAAEVKKRKLPTRILPLSAFTGASYVRSMLDAGAAGYILKDEALETVVEAVHTVARGEHWYSHQIMAEMKTLANKENLSIKEIGLTEREIELLSLLTKGWDNQSIGEALCITEQTVKNYVSRIYTKLGVNTRVEAAIRSIELGLGPDP